MKRLLLTASLLLLLHVQPMASAPAAAAAATPVAGAAPPGSPSTALVGGARDSGDILDLPIVPLDGTPLFDAMAIIYSGDGGWRDLDRTIGGVLQGKGVPTVGVDSLQYFLSEKDPSTMAADLSRIMDVYMAKWNVRHVLLAGYSFGADVLPAAVDALGDEHRACVAQLSLLGFSSTAEFHLSINGWLGLSHAGRPTLPDLRELDLSKVQCVYGREEEESACPQLEGSGAELIETEGGHHFDGDYPALADRLLSGLQRRLPAAPGCGPE